MRRASWALSLICFLAVLVLPSWGAAQSVTASAGGTVLDATGSAIVGAKVRLLSEGTGALRETVSDPNGAFIFNAIPPGDYTLEAGFTGFKTYKKQNIQLIANDNLALGEIRLEVGAVTESVTVLAEGTTVQTASGERSGVITSDEMENLTVMNRDFSALVSLLPGVVDEPGAETQSFSGNARFNVLGGRQTGNNVTIDGAASDNTNASNNNNYVSMDAVRTVKIMVSNYQAEFGRKPGAGIMAVTKSGTRKIGGSAYGYYRNEAFNAANFFNNRAGLQEPPYRYSTAGLTLGGPLNLPKLAAARNKLFFFLSSEQLREMRPQDIRQVTAPTAKERSGDFGESRDSNGAVIYVKDPLLGLTCSSSNQSGCFPGMVIPRQRLNQSMLNYFKLLPIPNILDPAVTRRQYNYQVQESLNIPKTMETLRVDYNIDHKTTVYGRFNYWWEKAQGWAVSASNPNWGWLPSTYRNWTRSLVLSATRILGPSLILEGSTTVSRWMEAGPPIRMADVERLNRKNAGVDIPQFHPENNPYGLVPALTFGSGVTNPANPSYNVRFPLRGAETVFTWTATATKTHGAHASKFGVYAERWRAVKGESGTFAGSFNFGRDTNSPVDANYPYATALLGNFTNYTESSSRPPLYEFTTSVEWFAQDNWRVHRRLTLDVGLRFGWSQPFHSHRRQEAGFLPQRYDPSKRVLLMPPAMNGRTRMALNPLSGEFLPAVVIGAIVPGSGVPYNGTVDLAVDGSYPDGLRDTTGLKTAPRFGFAYDPLGKGKTAIRGGFGVFYEIHEKDIWSNNLHLNPPKQLNPTIYYGNIDSFMTAPGYQFPSTTNGIERGRALGRMMSYSFGIQQNVGFGTVLDVSYVGSLGRHLLQSRNLNSTPLGSNFLPANLDATNSNRALPVHFLRPYVGYGDIWYYEYSGNSSYHSLQAQANRRMARNLQFGAAWTWSKAMDYADTEGSRSAATTVSNLVSPRIWNYGKAGFDRTHILKLWYIYNVPRLSRLWGNVLVRKALDEWQVSGVTTFMSGAPTPVTLQWASGASTEISGSTDTARPLMIANPVLPKSQRIFSRNLNTAAFMVPPVGAWGNAAKDVFRGPGINNWDISVFKNFRLGPERLRWQFRGETYNSLNHTQFRTLDTNPQFGRDGLPQNSRCGEFTAARNPRRVQLALRLNF